MYKRFAVSPRALLVPLFGLLLGAGCSGSGEDTGDHSGSGDTGGTAASGGTVTGGAAPATGGAIGTGGTVAGTGGVPATGGTVTNTGGTATNTGGTVTNTGGTVTSTGGTVDNTGGTSTGGIAVNTGGTVDNTGGATETGGTEEPGGAANTGGESNTGGAPETGGQGTNGDLTITDPVPGYASVSGGTTGGGTDLGSAVTVSSMGELQSAASGSNPAIILVEPGNYSGSLSPGSNKTIIGTAPGVKITGSLSISGSDHNNLIIRNIAVQGERCNSYDECKAGADAVYIGKGAHHVWLDHFDISDGQDGNCDITRGGDYITVSWTKFYYTYDKEHRFSNLIAGSDDEPESVGKLHITYMDCDWGDRVDQRQPRGRFGNIHMLNNYHHTGGSQIHGVGLDMALIAENCVYNENRSIWTDMGSPRGWRGIGNTGTASDMTASRGTVFDIPYDYTAMPASEVVAAVTSQDCGAGNTCTFEH